LSGKSCKSDATRKHFRKNVGRIGQVKIFESNTTRINSSVELEIERDQLNLLLKEEPVPHGNYR